MQNLNNLEVVEEMFQMVIWITMSVENEVNKQQMEIARRLKLNLQGIETSTGRARRIEEELKDRKYLLLLDGVSSLVDRHWLSRIGVPDNQNGSKVVLTTRDRAVCSGMHSVRVIEVKQLSPPEAWEMFKQTVTDEKIKSPGVTAVAQLVARECGGLPFVINKVACYLRYDSHNDHGYNDNKYWRYVLEELRKGSTADIPNLTQIHSVLKGCYERLEGEKKICFLYGALHPPDTQIPSDYLVLCWAAERLLGNIDEKRSLRAACDKGYGILRYLTEASLLQAGRSMEHVQVNKVVQQVALHILSKDNEHKFVVGDQTEEDWKLAKRIFLIDAGPDCLPAHPSCPEVRTLLLQKNSQLKAIPQLLFKAMKELVVLNLSETAVESLPCEIEELQRLGALFLNNCRSISELPSQMENLRHLLVLDIRGCQVDFLPPFIGKLVLRCLRVSYHKTGTGNGRSNVISELLKLEELVIEVDSASYPKWCDEATNVIGFVTSLKNLTSLHIRFPKTEHVWTFMEKWRVNGDSKQHLHSGFLLVAKKLQILDYFSETCEKLPQVDRDILNWPNSATPSTHKINNSEL